MTIVPPVRVSQGLLQGVTSNVNPAVTVYKGIHYGADTSGPNRWRAPQPPASWEGVKVADKFGAPCPQVTFGIIELETPASEDCLTLNVWTPTEASASPLPVYVWIYGGRFIAGSGTDPMWDGANIASKGCIVVTLDYRIGILGFLGHPDLTAEAGSSGNYGVLDQVAALQWVHDNIAAFGGDPTRVTIGGQSAGAASCGIHLVSPLSKGLFQRAIPQAGQRVPTDPLISGLAPSYRTKEKAERQGVETLALKGAASIAHLRTFPVEKLIEDNNKNDDQWGNPPFWRPCIDGYALPASFSECLAQGIVNDVDVITGHNADEGGTYADPAFDLEDFKSCAEQKYGDFAARFFELYKPASDAEARLVWNEAARNHSRITVTMWAEGFRKIYPSRPVYGYIYSHVPPLAGAGKGGASDGSRTTVNPQLRIYETAVPRSTYTYSKIGPGAVFGASHGAELPYVFHNFHTQVDKVFSDVDEKVSEYVQSYWLNFIKTGNPNGTALDGVSTLPEFPKAEGGRFMHLCAEPAEIGLAETPEREQFWRDFLTAQKAW